MHFFLQVLESIISEKTNLLEKHPKKDIGQVEKVSVVRDIKSGSKRLLQDEKNFRNIYV